MRIPPTIPTILVLALSIGAAELEGRAAEPDSQAKVDEAVNRALRGTGGRAAEPDSQAKVDAPAAGADRDAQEMTAVDQVRKRHPEVQKAGRVPVGLHGAWVLRKEGATTEFLVIGPAGLLRWSGVDPAAKVAVVRAGALKVAGQSVSYIAPVVYAEEMGTGYQFTMPLRVQLAADGDTLRVSEDKKEVKTPPRTSATFLRWKHMDITMSGGFLGGSSKTEQHMYAGGDTTKYQRLVPPSVEATR
jgi:hypothetical protein